MSNAEFIEDVDVEAVEPSKPTANSVRKFKKPSEVPALDKLLPSSGASIFLLARVAMVRALEINAGSPPLVDFLPTEKETTIALREIAQGKVVIKGNEIIVKRNKK